jgi:hypothetical protein
MVDIDLNVKFKIMKTVFTPTVSFLALIGLGLFSSCKKENVPLPQQPAETFASVSQANVQQVEMEATFNEVSRDASGIDALTAGEDIGLYGNSGEGIFSGESNNGLTGLTNQPSLTKCYTVTVTPRERGVFPKTVIIDFGTGCYVRGHKRSGKIITVYTGKLSIPGSLAKTTFENYRVDSFLIQGTHVFENSTKPGGNYRRFTRYVYKGKRTNENNGEWTAMESVQTDTQIEGNGSPEFPKDDAFSTEGKGEVQFSNGKYWTFLIVEPLIKRNSCRWTEKGILKAVINKDESTLDYGDGTCDNKAILTFNGQSKTIELR